MYTLANKNELWWCNIHRRQATYVRNETYHCCDPKLGGIMIPCNCVDLTNECKIMKIDDSKSIMQKWIDNILK